MEQKLALPKDSLSVINVSGIRQIASGKNHFFLMSESEIEVWKKSPIQREKVIAVLSDDSEWVALTFDETTQLLFVGKEKDQVCVFDLNGKQICSLTVTGEIEGLFIWRGLVAVSQYSELLLYTKNGILKGVVGSHEFDVLKPNFIAFALPTEEGELLLVDLNKTLFFYDKEGKLKEEKLATPHSKIIRSSDPSFLYYFVPSKKEILIKEIKSLKVVRTVPWSFFLPTSIHTDQELVYIQTYPHIYIWKQNSPVWTQH